MSDPNTRWRAMEGEAVEIEARGRRALALFNYWNLPVNHPISKYLRGEATIYEASKTILGLIVSLRNQGVTLGKMVADACQGPRDSATPWITRMRTRTDEEMVKALELYSEDNHQACHPGGGSGEYGAALSKMNDYYPQLPGLRVAQRLELLNLKDAEDFKKKVEYDD